MRTRIRITGNDVPDDVWRVVANDILQSGPVHDLYRLISVNRTFFNVVLDMKYREVRWTKVDGSMVRMLARLQEPIIASRVKKLFIRAWFVELLLKRDMFHKDTPKTFLGRLIHSFMTSYFKRKSSEVQQQHRHEKGRMHGDLTDALPSKIIHFMIKAVSGMTNVTELNFEWRDLPINKDTRIFLTSTRTTFDTSLRNLVLRAQVCKFKELLAITNFDNVDELDFHFDYRPNTISKGQTTVTTDTNEQLFDRQALESDIQGLLETVVPFIEHRRISLNSLTISSSSMMDLSRFFKALPPMPALHRFAARIYFDKNCLQDVSAILHILKTHSRTLLHVELRPNLPERDDNNRGQNLLEKQLDWLRLNELLITCPAALHGLESLEIPYVSPAKTVRLLCRSRDTLTHLCLTDHFLTEGEVTEVVGIFSHRPFEMRHFHIQVENAHTQLLYMLASRFPGLFSLVLVCRKPPLADIESPNEVVKATLLDWKLCCLSVYIGRYLPSLPDAPPQIYIPFMEELEIMERISALIPSVNYWKGYSKRYLIDQRLVRPVRWPMG
ncbi:hypothetical protein BYT27DRAFT_7107977 [Phlegmacium glaucopus]|nr:hypothetical protein BYT27DRAFT_7107977 [Phlegmacium glaucopus]